MLDIKNIIVGMLLLGAALGSSAMSLGRLQGGAWVGQALDVRVQIQLDEQEGASSLCPEVEVFHGDMQQASGRIRVSVEPMTQPLIALLRIRSSAPVDEPIVTVYLKAGCQAKTSRRYVLLAELPVEAASTAAAVSVAPSTRAPAASVAPPLAVPVEVTPGLNRPAAQPKPRASPAKVRTATSSSQPVKREAATPKPVKVTSPKVPLVKPMAKAPEAKSRLSLEILEPLDLRFEGEQRLAPTPAAAMAGDVQPPEVSPEGHLLKKMEGQVKLLLAQASKNEKGLTDLGQRLKQAQAERYDNVLVYTLAALLLGTLVLLGYLWLRRAKTASLARDSWQDSIQAANAMASQSYESTRLASLPAGAKFGSSMDLKQGRVDVNLEDIIAHLDSHDTMPPMAIEGHKPESEEKAKFLKKRASDFSHSVATLMRSMPAKEISDSRDQAGFFVSLGQTDEAINILKSIINTEGATSPWVYLDLLKIFHDLGMKEDYKLLSEKFRQSFKGRPPEYEWFREEGKDLAGYPDVLAYICSLWPTSQVLKALETNIFRAEGEGRSSDFDLDAFRELLLLHAMTLCKMEPEVNVGIDLPTIDRRHPA